MATMYPSDDRSEVTGYTNFNMLIEDAMSPRIVILMNIICYCAWKGTLAP